LATRPRASAAAAGTPNKLAIQGVFGRVEFLGRGQPFVAHGLHFSGVPNRRFPYAPWQQLASAIRPVAEPEVLALLTRIAPIIGAPDPRPAFAAEAEAEARARWTDPDRQAMGRGADWPARAKLRSLICSSPAR
jgi:hypothetical protein